MVAITSKVVKSGNSYAVRIPAELVKSGIFDLGDLINLELKENLTKTLNLKEKTNISNEKISPPTGI